MLCHESRAWAVPASVSGIVVFTDGYGPAPDRGPREQVIWVLMGSGVRQPAPWGAVVRADGSTSPLPSEHGSPQ